MDTFDGGKTTKKLVTAENWWGNKLMLIENVPAWVCDNCGEQYFEPEVCEELDRLRQSPPANKKLKFLFTIFQIEDTHTKESRFMRPGFHAL